jgi:hypothetical protein
MAALPQPPRVANANANNALPPVNGNVTYTELGDQLVFAVDAASALIPGTNLQGGPPAWAGPLLGLSGAIAAVTASHTALAARLANGLCEAADDLITAVPNAAGNPLPAGFPANRGAIDHMPAAALGNLLA